MHQIMYRAMHRVIEHSMKLVGHHLIAHLAQHGPDLIEHVTEKIEDVTEKYDDWRRGRVSSESKELSPEVRKFLDRYKAEQEEQAGKGE